MVTLTGQLGCDIKGVIYHFAVWGTWGPVGPAEKIVERRPSRYFLKGASGEELEVFPRLVQRDLFCKGLGAQVRVVGSIQWKDGEPVLRRAEVMHIEDRSSEALESPDLK